MSDTTADDVPTGGDAEPQADFLPDPSFVPEPLEETTDPFELPASDPDVLADVRHPVGSLYDPMPLMTQVDTSRNWLGVVAIIFGVLPGALIAIVFGILGLRAAKQGRADNRGFSIGGIVLGVLWTLVGIGWLIAASAAPSIDPGLKVAVGDCYVSTLGTTGDISAEPAFGPCTAQSTGQVFDVRIYGGNATPSDETFIEDLASLCTSDEALKAVDETLAGDYFVELYVPFADEWDTKPHTVICGLATEGEPIDPEVVIG